jgi:hypothetical protein
MKRVTRAQFHVSEVKLNESLMMRDDIEYRRGDSLGSSGYVMKETGEPFEGNLHVSFHRPTVTLTAVSGAAPENERFFEASPGGTLTITIANPRAAEHFNLGQDYYLDFIPCEPDAEVR